MAQKGFRPARTLSGGHKFRSRSYAVAANNPHDLFIGHAVTLNSAKSVVGVSTTTTSPLLGVIKATYTATRNRPRTNDSGGLYIPASTAAYVEVYDDPDIIYSVSMNASANVEMIGRVGDVVAAASGVPFTGQSGQVLDASSLVVEARVSGGSNATSLPFKVVAIPSDLERYVATSGQRVDVIINNHLFKPVL